MSGAEAGCAGAAGAQEVPTASALDWWLGGVRFLGTIGGAGETRASLKAQRDMKVGVNFLGELL